MIITVRGRQVGYDAAGHGPPLLLVHAFPLNRTMWAPQTSALAAHAGVLAPDLPGFGESDPLDAPATMDAWADALVELMDALGVERAAVCGLSLGGYVALALWRRHAERVRALVLASTRATADDAATRARRLELADLARREGAAAVAAKQITGLVGKSTRERRPDLVALLERTMAAASPDAIVAALDAMRARPDSTPTLATIRVPTLVVHGDEDAITGAAEMRAIHDGVRGSGFQSIGGAGHMCNVERPAAFNLLVGGFLAGLDWS